MPGGEHFTLSRVVALDFSGFSSGLYAAAFH
jgi:hypothetical protein